MLKPDRVLGAVLNPVRGVARGGVVRGGELERGLGGGGEAVRQDDRFAGGEGASDHVRVGVAETIRWPPIRPRAETGL